MRDLYRSALVHCCPSWYETPGLASLEALACGCRIVTTSLGSAREYFGAHALYCEPNDVKSIATSVSQALGAAPAPRVAADFRDRYNWLAAAEQTLKAYRLALEPAPSRSEMRPAWE